MTRLYFTVLVMINMTVRQQLHYSFGACTQVMWAIELRPNGMPKNLEFYFKKLNRGQ